MRRLRRRFEWFVSECVNLRQGGGLPVGGCVLRAASRWAWRTLRSESHVPNYAGVAL